MRGVEALLVAVLIAQLAVPMQAAPARAERVVVSLDGVDPATVATLVEQAGGSLSRVDGRLGFAVVETARPDLLDSAGLEVAADARGAGGAEVPGATVPDDTRYPIQWGPTELNAPQAWSVEPGDPNVTVAIVDSGIDWWHEDLEDERLELGHDYVSDNELPYDEHGHGTHVGGIVAATRDNGQGVAGMGDVTLYVTRVLDGSNAGWCSDFASGIREAVDAGADIVNLSLYCNSDYGPLEDAVRYAADHGVLVVSITGNFQSSAPERCVTYPGRYPEAIAVAALDPTLTPASYSCRGPEAELAAPGSRVDSTLPGDRYGPMSGTSMAAPHVSGVAALVLADDPSRSADEVRALMAESARDLGPPDRDDLYGHGMVDPVAALTGSPVHVPAS